IDVDQIFTTIAAGQIEHHSLLLSVNASGIYFIDAQLVGSPGASAESMEEAKAAGVVAESVIWGGTTYTTVSLEQISGIA
ncbi:MAG: hypothetical protein GY726_12970, partial [Proteobacteria bacterium]|nr:hypothetical protein [Pseudomonadota bacterium]